MKLLSVSLARAVWVLHLNDLNPRGRSVEKNVILEIGRKYQFPRVPTPVEIVEARSKNQPITLAGGTYRAREQTDVEVGLSIYRDALFADTRSDTEDAEAFLNEMLDWLANEFGLIDHSTLGVRKLYVSELYVSLSGSLNRLNPAFAKLAEFMQSKIETPFQNISFEAAALAFWIDPAVKHVHVPFRLERQSDIAFEENRYYSMAPLGTSDHLRALELLEKLTG